MSESSTKKWIAVARILTGALLIHMALPKFSSAYLEGFPNLLNSWVNGNPFPWYKSFLQTVGGQHDQTLAMALAACEMLAGVGLLLGFLAGLAAILGFAVTLNHLLATSHLAAGSLPFTAPAWETPNVYLLILLALLFVAKSGRTWGLAARQGSSKSILW